MKRLKIAIVVPGRFHAFALANALIKQGQDVTVFTNYPKFIVRKWGIPSENVRSFLSHGLLARLVNYLRLSKSVFFESLLCQIFSSWAYRKIKKDKYDVIHVFSGVAEEILKHEKALGGSVEIVRASFHIETQSDLLCEEEKRVGVRINKPTRWMINREKREYELADHIIVLSSSSEKDFFARGIPKEKITKIPLGVDPAQFGASQKIFERRCQRILAKEKLNILTTGTFSFRKGAIDLVKVAEECRTFCKFTFVGDVPMETQKMQRSCSELIQFIPRQSEFKLREFYDQADLFIFCTIEDGFPVVLAQAQADALPILTTQNCSGPDIVTEGVTGWVFPIRSPQLMIERLKWCDTHRKELAQIVKNVYECKKTETCDTVSLKYIDVWEQRLVTRGRCFLNR